MKGKGRPKRYSVLEQWLTSTHPTWLEQHSVLLFDATWPGRFIDGHCGETSWWYDYESTLGRTPFNTWEVRVLDDGTAITYCLYSE